MQFNADKIYRKIKKYKIVSFDIFDTLVKRNVSCPSDIFDIVEKEYNKIYSNIQINDFKNSRILAEKKAREKHPDLEVTLDEIYLMLMFPTECKIRLKELEIMCEIKYCTPNIQVVDLFDKCIIDEMTVIITSDMYLPEKVIVEILNKCGISKYKKIYLSSSIGKKKSTGELFDYIIKDLQIRSKDIIHLGDRKKADNIIPRLKGINSVYIEPLILNTEFLKKKEIKDNSFLFPFINNNLVRYSDRSDMFRWGYEALGPLLLGFCTWVHQQIEKRGIEKAYFLARDMNLVIQIYKKFYGDQNIDYLEVSRKSLRTAYVIKNNCLDSIFDTISRMTYSFGEILQFLDLKAENCLCNCSDRNFSEKRINKIDGFPKWFQNVSPHVLKELKMKDNYAIQYLQQHGLYDKKNKALIDIGWHATIQNILEKLTNEHFTGLYFGNTKRNYFGTMDMSGYWFDSDDETKIGKYLNIIYILESMLFTNIGTTIGYIKTESGIVPEYGKCEENNFDLIFDFQKGALQFVNDIMVYKADDLVLKSDDAVLAYYNLTTRPALKHARAFSKIKYEDGKIFNLASCKSFGYYILHPVIFVKDYSNAKWCEGFIKQIIPIINNPYAVANFLRKIIIIVSKVKHAQLRSKNESTICAR